jgi:hypothetical protein
VTKKTKISDAPPKPKNVVLESAPPLDGQVLPPDTDVALSEPRNKYAAAYRPEFADQAAKLCALGAIDAELADFFCVSMVTINNWKSWHADFARGIRVGKDQADDRVERALYSRAVGYTFDAVRIFVPKDGGGPVLVPYREHVAPDVTACIFWLKNRRSEKWRDVFQHKHSGAVNVSITESEADFV